MVRFTIGRILLVEAVLMLFPLVVTLLYHEQSIVAFLIPIVILLIPGLICGWKTPENTALYAKDGLAIVALAWILMSLAGALPFFISGSIPNFADCIFETVSGFTTTGATLLRSVENLEHGILFWRSFTHWIGGMGVLVFVMAILPMSDGHGMHLMRAEVPGPSVGKLVSRMSDTAKILYAIYLGMTVIVVILLVCGGMPLFDSLINAFGTAGTGGFSCRDLSISSYNSLYFELVIGTFMLLFGINFNLYYFILIGRARDVFRSEELLTYLGIVAFSTLTIAADISNLCGSFGEGLRQAFFQVSSIITTTGFATADYNYWPTYSKTVLFILMFTGACAGSTSGGIKQARIIILCKSALRDMRRLLHPNAVSTIRFEGKPVDEKTVKNAHLFISVYLLILVGSILLLSLEQMDMIDVISAVVTCINNVGPGFGIVGPRGSFADFSSASKILLSFDMLVGRLEIFPMLLLFAPSVWWRNRAAKRACRKH